MIQHLLEWTGVNNFISHPYILLIFLIFLITTSIHDIKTKTILNLHNLIFFLVGLLIWILDLFCGFELGFSNIWYFHFVGAIVGFVILFIPGMITNSAIGGDIKFATTMGFWVGPYMIVLIMLGSTLIQLLLLLGLWIKTKDAFSIKTTLPYAPAFTLAYITLIILAFIC